MGQVRNLLSRVFGIVGLVQKLSILSCFGGRYFVQIDAFVAQLGQEFRHKHHSCDVTSRDQVQFTSMSQLAQPEVVGLLIQQGCHRQFQRVAPFNVQLLRKCRWADGPWKCQAADLLVIKMIFVLLPVRIEIKAICPDFVRGSLASW